MKRRLLSVLLAFTVILGLLPMAALAEDTALPQGTAAETALPPDTPAEPEPSAAETVPPQTEDVPRQALPAQPPSEAEPSADEVPVHGALTDIPPVRETPAGEMAANSTAEDAQDGEQEPATNAAITVPRDAVLFVGTKSKHYVSFTPVQPVKTEEGTENTTIYFFNLANGTYNFRVSGPGYVTCAGTFKKAADAYSLTVTAAELRPDGVTPTTVDHDVSSNGGFNVADVYLNINPQGYLRLNSGERYQLVNLRSWEAVDGITSNYFIEPDYHYTVLDENGAPGSGVVSVSDSGLLTAEGSGTAIVLVTYDAINVTSAAGGPFFGAIWPENTGVFVVGVDAGDSGITTGMTLNAGRNTTDSKLSGDALDAEHDVIYFAGDSGSYTFTPGTAGCAVSVANPTVWESMTFSGFAPVAANGDGSFTVPLAEGRNIVKLTRDGKSEYQVITAKRVTYTVNGGAPVHPGDPLSIVFDTVYHPANKLAGVYNMSALLTYAQMDGYTGSNIIGATANQYKFASTDAAQKICFLLKPSGNAFRPYTNAGGLTVPEDYAADILTLSGGSVIATGFGDPYGNHRGITLTAGKDPNFNADTRTAYLGQLPDITIPIVVTDAELTGITLTTEGVRTEYVAGDAFDPANLVVTARYADGKTQTVSNYTVSPGVLTADTTEVTITCKGKTAAIPVTVAPLELVSIAVTAPPARTAYRAGEVFDPTGMVVTGTYNSGKTAQVTDYSYTPNRELTAEDTAITVKHGELTASTAITVSAAVTPGPDDPTPQQITVRFTLLGDGLHDSDSDGKRHTLKDNNLSTWIAQTAITVPQNSRVIDAASKALGLAGIPYENPTGNYITSIRGLGEFSNGTLSGWMYTLNGTHPDLGVSEQILRDGDVIVFHYTDDYTVERGSENWSGGSTGGTGGSGPAGTGSAGGTAGTAQPEITVSTTPDSRGQATAQVTEAMLKAAIAGVKSSGSGRIVIAPDTTGAVSAVSVSLPGAAVQEIVRQTGAALAVETAVGSVEIPNAALGDILNGAKGSDLTVTVEAQTGGPGAELLARLAETFSENQLSGSVVTEVTMASGGTAITAWGGKGITLHLPVPDSGFKAGQSCTVWQFSADGSSEVLTAECVEQNKTLYAVLTATHLSTFVALPNAQTQLPFSDVKEGDWWYDAVAYAYENGLFNGTSGTTFSPTAAMTRSMLVTVLWRLEGEPAAAQAASFSDVESGTWYAGAVAWANSLGIVTGSGGQFDPDGDVTREQIAAILYRYARYKGRDVSAGADLSAFPDSDTTSGWAVDALRWAAGAQLIRGGDGGRLSPRSGAARAEVAAILMRMLEGEKQESPN